MVDTGLIWKRLETVMDPEVPALSVLDLGIVRDVRITHEGHVQVDVTPTYSGCPATELIHTIIQAAIETSGYPQVAINSVLSPAWTTDWITEEGRAKLKDYGIAAPVGMASSGKAVLFGASPIVECPQCDSNHTECVSEFGSTACKSMYRCKDCLEPFEYFKCI
ncbi:phenylacetate-CoA oxygenase subunit PaaJ [Temperatibacter marinus]|uniref:Phenylacetate-CoA oxygenase subunit PaaJ n=1 Tax=Temperatibacter marinus TaxID=1456591 RepID=A0AA52HB10_9PROT|nr:1,2-phenylacetyl-CoA epoxidase subunit PaaD [Temperatibacter marinus]WND04162.1 phenylacetate-CoA oxygenase subunit PaaJ [Temperatibacter marinus]